MKKINVLTACYNEEDNVKELYLQVRSQFESLSDRYTYEHIFIDNASTDRTVEILKEIASQDRNVKIIVNAKNFGHIRSPFHGLKQCYGDAVIKMVADLQDPPSMIPELLNKWEEGHQLVVCIKNKSHENRLMYGVRTAFYKVLARMSETNLIENFTGFGLYDKSFVDVIRTIEDPYPYLRGLVAEYGGDIVKLSFTQPVRAHGKTKNNFYTLYDMAMLGFVSYSKVPLRLATFIGFCLSIISIIIAIFYFVYKLLYWDSFQVGSAPLVIGLFFFSAVQLFFIGIVGEYVGSILTQVKNHPLVVEKERINF